MPDRMSFSFCMDQFCSDTSHHITAAASLKGQGYVFPQQTQAFVWILEGILRRKIEKAKREKKLTKSQGLAIVAVAMETLRWFR